MIKGIKITHKQFQQQVEDLFKTFGWLYYFTWKAYHSPKGYPDYTATRGTRMLWAKLKVGKDKLSTDQELWRYALNQNPHNEWYLWKPEDFEEIVGILR